jgi:hypothetical protein
MRPNGYVSVVWVIVLAALMAGCGSSNSSGQPKPTGLTKRVLLTNQQSNTVNLLNAQKDVFTTKNIGSVAPTKLLTAGGQTVVLDSTQNDLTVIDNTKEAASFSLLLNDVASDIALTPDGKTVFAAERNSSAIQFATTDNGGVSPIVIHVPAARRLAISPKGTRLLIFSDPQAQVAGDTHSFFIIDTASKGIIQVQSPNLDQPFNAVFGASDDQAFILNCGAECGGVSASVTLVNFSGVFANPQVPAVVGTPLPVAGATVGLLNGSNLFVAGTPPTLPLGVACPISRCGTLNIVNTSAFTASAPVAITDGLHEKMALANSRLYIGASGCTVQAGTAANTVRGCLSIFNTGTPGVKFPEESAFRQNFDVTGLQPISNRSVIYIVQGGELDIFDTTTDALATGITQLDIVGRAIDVVQIDP